MIGMKDCDLAEGDLGVFDPRFPGKSLSVRSFVVFFFDERGRQVGRPQEATSALYHVLLVDLCQSFHCIPGRPLSLSLSLSLSLARSLARSLVRTPPPLHSLASTSGGPFDLDLSNPSQRATAQEILFAASYRTGCTLVDVFYAESATGAGGGGGRGEPSGQ